MHTLLSPTHTPFPHTLAHLVVEALVTHVANGVPVLGALLVARGEVALQLAWCVQMLLSDENLAVYEA
jgi:hypothetical protein